VGDFLHREEKVVLFIDLFERVDYGNKITAKKTFLINVFIGKIDSFVRFCIPVFV